MVVANVDPDVATALKERAHERHQSMRAYVADALAYAARSAATTHEPTSDDAAPDYIPVLLRVKDDVASGATARDLAQSTPPSCTDGAPLSSDAMEATLEFAREMQLVRRSREWWVMVENGRFEEEMTAPSDPE